MLLCTGKVFYDLARRARDAARDDETAIMRLEQLYPLSERRSGARARHVRQAEELVWVQEEPANMGAHRYIFVRLLEVAGHRSVHA